MMPGADASLLRLISTPTVKQFMDNDSFKRWMTDTVFALTSEQPGVVSAAQAE